MREVINKISDKQLVRLSLTFVAASIILGLFALIYHDAKKIVSADQLLWSAIDNALSTNGVTTYSLDSDSSQETKQSNDLRFVLSPVVHSSVQVVTNSGGKVNSETYGEIAADFVRYTEFEGPTGSLNPVVKGVWGQVPIEDGTDGKLLTDTLSSATIMLGNFDTNVRQQFRDELKNNSAYAADGIVANKQRVDDRTAAVIKVVINPGEFTKALKKYLALLNLKNSANQIPAEAGATSDLSAEFAIDRSTNEIIKIGIPTLAAARATHFTDWGKSDVFPKPISYITYDDLQEHLIIKK